MFQQQIIVTFNDGQEVSCTATQADVSAWEMFCLRSGLRSSSPDRTLLQEVPMTAMRYMAWSALHPTGSGPRPSYDDWNASVAEAMPVTEGGELVDPTLTGTPVE